jgi:aryl carrier-like protein
MPTSPRASNNGSSTTKSALTSAEIQRVVGLIWEEVLQRAGHSSADENFFEAGGDSLAMMMLLFRVKEALGPELMPTALMESPTLGQFWRLVEARVDYDRECLRKRGDVQRDEPEEVV